MWREKGTLIFKTTDPVDNELKPAKIDIILEKVITGGNGLTVAHIRKVIPFNCATSSLNVDMLRQYQHPAVVSMSE